MDIFCIVLLCIEGEVHLIGLRGNLVHEWQLNSSIPKFAHAFTAGGYDTALSGRMHFVGSDQRHGFSQRIIGDAMGTAYPQGIKSLKNVLGDLVDTPGMSLTRILKSGPGRTGYQAYDEAVTRATVDWRSGAACATLHRHFFSPSDTLPPIARLSRRRMTLPISRI